MARELEDTKEENARLRAELAKANTPKAKAKATKIEVAV
jgi:hypothetical protein